MLSKSLSRLRTSVSVVDCRVMDKCAARTRAKTRRIDRSNMGMGG